LTRVISFGSNDDKWLGSILGFFSLVYTFRLLDLGNFPGPYPVYQPICFFPTPSKKKNTIKVDTKTRKNVYMEIQIFVRQFDYKCLFIILNGRLDMTVEFNSIKVDLLILIRVGSTTSQISLQ